MLAVPPVVPLNVPKTTHKFVAKTHAVKSGSFRATEGDSDVSTAIVYCEANFGDIDGKTANGLIRRSEKYKILSVIDSEKAGLDTGMVLDNKPNAIPICRDLAEALSQTESVPDFFIFGMAPSSGMLSKHERGLVLEAMSHGMNI